MASRIYVRPLVADEAEAGAALCALDAAYAKRHGLEPVLTPGSLSFYARSGHAFVAYADGAPSGFVLAQAVWSGERPVVQVSRLAAAEGDAASCRVLVEALTKSAYDAAVYDIEVLHPDADAAGAEAWAAQAYRAAGRTVYRRVLGSRGRRGE